MEHGEIEELYEKSTGLRGRYRVLEKIQGSGPGIMKGTTIYRQGEDMAGLGRTIYLYPPYLLEALMHLFAFYPDLRREEGGWNLIPAGLEELRFTRPAKDGERFSLEARLRSRDKQGFTWDARSLDENGTSVLQVLSMRMNRFSL
jgi:hypothetical protein